MAQTISIKHFKSYSNADLHLSSLTVLVGANASGKSNFLEALQLITWVAQGQKLSALQYLVNSDEKVLRGRVNDFPSRGSNAFSFIYCDSDEPFGYLEMKFEVRPNEELHLKSEVCKDPKQEGSLYETVEPSTNSSTDIRVAYNNFKRGGKNPQIICSDQQPVFMQLANANRFADSHAKSREIIPKTAKYFEKKLSNILFLDPVPMKMREYSFLSDKRLLGDGRNLSSVLHDLCSNGIDKNNKVSILDFISSLPEQDIVDIGFLTGPRGEVMVQLKETFGGIEKDYDASLLSDGTLRVLAIAAALLSAPEGSMVVIEEIDNGVHPNRASKLLSQMKKIADKRNLTLLITTHNPALLNALPNTAIPNVVFCFRDPKSGTSRLMRLKDLIDYPELIIQGPLGDLMTSGVLDKFIKFHPNEDIKMEQALRWLESIK